MSLALLLLLAQAGDPYSATLRDRGVEPDAQGVVRYLDRLSPTDANRARAAELVRALGHDDFDTRESAASELRMLSPMLRALASEAIDLAVQSNDLEIQSRVRRLLKEDSSAEARFVLRAALLRAARLKAAGTVEAVLSLVGHVKDPTLRGAMEIAARDAAGKDDEALLRAALNDGDAGRRALAASGLGRLLADLEPVKTLLDDAHEEVRLAAARALLDRGDPAGLEPLAALLSSGDERVRRRAASTLRLSTGLQLDSPEAWIEWIRKEGAAAKLTFPLPDRPAELGRTLISLYNQNKVIELDRSGKVVFEASLAQPWGCEGLPNGHRLVVSYSEKKVVEFDDAGKEVWSKTDLSGQPMGAQRLEDGHTLIALYGAQRVIEVAPDGSTVREAVFDANPTDARQLDDGRWLVTIEGQGKVVEVDRAGETVWTLDGLTTPRTAQRLDNGNTLVAEMGANRVVEFDRAGRMVWSQDGLSRPFDAQRLESGNTLVSDSNGVTEFDPKGKEVWKYANSSGTRVSRY